MDIKLNNEAQGVISAREANKHLQQAGKLAEDLYCKQIVRYSSLNLLHLRWATFHAHML